MTPTDVGASPTDLRYNLLQDPAVTPADADGVPVPVSLARAILDAHAFTDLVVPVPTMVPALLRQVLVPILIHALGQPDPDTWEQRFHRGQFTKPERDTLTDYFKQFGDRFDLTGPSAHPFGQTPGLRAATGEVKPVSVLLPQIATGNNVPLFSPFTDAAGPELSPMEAFWALVHCLCWDTAALKTGAEDDPKVSSGTTKGNPTGPLGQLGVVVPLGTTLFETLMLNLPVAWHDLSGTPQWAREAPPGPTWDQYPPGGLLELLTWPSRRIRLLAEDRPGGMVVTGAICTAGDRISVLPEWEPHTLWKRSTRPRDKGQLVPMRHRSGRAAWRSLAALLALGTEDSQQVQTSALLDQIGGFVREDRVPIDYPLRVAIFGLEYGTQSAVVDNAIVDQTPLPVATLAAADHPARTSILEAVEQADRLRRTLDYYQNDLRQAAGGDKLEWDKGSHAGAELIAALDGPARRLLAGLRRVGDDFDRIEAGMAAWEQIAWQHTDRIAGRLRETVPPEAHIDARDGAATVGPVARAERIRQTSMRSVLKRETHRRDHQHATEAAPS